MNRTLALAAAVWMTVLVLAPGPHRSVAPDLRSQALESRACKPLAPLATLFEVVEVPGGGGLLAVRLEVSPRVELQEASWTLELPAGFDALGPTAGTVDPRAGRSTRAELLLEVLDPAAELLASGAAELALVVRGRLPGGADASPIERRCELRLGAGDDPAQETALFTNAETGARSRVAVLPSAHRDGR